MTRRPRRRAAALSRRAKLLLGAASVVLFIAGLYFGMAIGRPPSRPDLGSTLAPAEPAPQRPAEAARSLEAHRRPAVEAARLEEDALRERPAPLEDEVQPPTSTPRVALVIDDLGRSLGEVEALGRLGVPISYSVLPFETLTPQVVGELHRRGAEVLCHLPMEAKNGANPGPGALRLDMPPAELRAATRRALEAVPGAVGVNNHMGSGFSAHAEAMAEVLKVVRREGLFYLDSRTSADTQGYAVARRLGLPALERQVFLDTERDRDFIRGQFRELVRRAEEGEAGVVAIAHPYAETLEVLAAEVPEARARGIEFVPLSALLTRS